MAKKGCSLAKTSKEGSSVFFLVHVVAFVLVELMSPGIRPAAVCSFIDVSYIDTQWILFGRA